MIFKPYYHLETGCAAYLLGCGLGKCAVVEAHEEDALAFEQLRDGQEIELGNTRVKVFHIPPGHTPESVSLIATDLRRGADPWFVLTGDTLFVGAVGPPDWSHRSRRLGPFAAGPWLGCN